MWVFKFKKNSASTKIYYLYICYIENFIIFHIIKNKTLTKT